jgi:hypothetical protein
MELIDKFKHLPDELIHIIVNYTDVIVYRYGKYINRINNADKRYKMLTNIPKPMKSGTNRILIKLINKNDIYKEGYILEYTIGHIYIKINIKFVNYDYDGFDRYISIKSCYQYIFDANSNWCKLINYSM